MKMDLNLHMPILLIIIVQILLTSTSCMGHESYVMFETIQRPINQSIVTHIESAESLLHCAYKCQRRSSESVYFNDFNQKCYCNNNSDTNKHHDPDQPSITYGGFKKSNELVMTTDTLQTLEKSTTELVTQTNAVTSPTFTSTDSEYEDCVQIYEAGYNETKEYQIYIRQLRRHVNVMCYMMWDSAGPMTTIQMRNHEHFSFYRNWSEYVSGFVSVLGMEDYWLGLENIAAITNARQYGLEIYMIPEDTSPVSDPRYVSFKFDEFTINPDDNYRMTLAGPHSGNKCLPNYDGAYFGDGQEFSTFDQDNDLNDTINCADMLRSAWWFKDCGFDMNGPFINGTKSAPFMTFPPCWGSDVKVMHTSMSIFERYFI